MLGSEAALSIGNMLASNTSLTQLNLGWNKFRLVGAQDLARGMILKKCMTSLDQAKECLS